MKNLRYDLREKGMQSEQERTLRLKVHYIFSECFFR